MSANEIDRNDSYSYRGIIHRDFRHTKAGPEVTGPPKPKKKKDQCKKNKGGPHIGAWREDSHGWYKTYYCDLCGKHLYYDWWGGKEDRLNDLIKGL